jgi:hypothetical protein
MNDDESKAVEARAGDVARSVDGAADRIEKALRLGMARNTPIEDAPMLLAAALFVLREVGSTIMNLARQVADGGPVPLAPLPVPGAKKTGCASGRHDYGDGAVCRRPGCGKVKSAGGRPRKEEPPALTAEQRTVALPMGDAAADKYAGGGLGSSGVRR